MKKNNVNFKFVIGNLSDNDPFIRLMQIEGNSVVQTIYKTETKDMLLANAECLRALADYTNKLAEEYENAANIKAE